MIGVVSDASPLIALQQIGQLGLLGTIFGTVLIPPAVAREALSVEQPSWIFERALTKPLAPAVVAAGLGPGESEAISLALELRADRVIVDDLPARNLAQRLNIHRNARSPAGGEAKGLDSRHPRAHRQPPAGRLPRGIRPLRGPTAQGRRARVMRAISQTSPPVGGGATPVQSGSPPSLDTSSRMT